jgi:cobalamin biosynthesis protein CobT
MEDIEITKNCVTTECGHTFHANCLMRNVAFNGFGCPYCRFEMVEDVSDESEYEEDDEDGEEDDDDNDDDNDDEENDEEDDDQEEDQEEGQDQEELVEDEDDHVEDDDNSEDFNRWFDRLNNREIKPMPSFKLIEKKLIEQGVSYECLIKGIIYYSLHRDLDHDNYEECLKWSDKIDDIIDNTINSYTPEQEEEVTSVKEFNFYFLQDEYKERNFYKGLEDTMVDFLNLDDQEDALNNCNSEYDNLFANVLNEINVNNNNFIQIY